jgi:hypothetical protein
MGQSLADIIRYSFYSDPSKAIEFFNREDVQNQNTDQGVSISLGFILGWRADEHLMDYLSQVNGSKNQMTVSWHAYKSVTENFPERAEQLFSQLNQDTQKFILGELKKEENQKRKIASEEEKSH